MKHIPLILSLFLVASASAATVFYKAGDELVVESEYSSAPSYFLYQRANKKYRIEMCAHQIDMYRHTKLHYDAQCSSASFAILTGNQIQAFPMPTYRKPTHSWAHCSFQPVEYNEFSCRNTSTDPKSIVVEISYTSFEGSPVVLTYSGEDAVRALYQRLTGMIDTVPIGSVPSFVDVFGKEPLLVLKDDIVRLQSRLLELCREFARRKAAAAAAAQ